MDSLKRASTQGGDPLTANRLKKKFLCLCYEVAGGIMFLGCPSVRTYVVRTYVIALSLYVRTSRSCDRVI